MAVFKLAKYEADDDQIRPIRVRPTTVVAPNTEPSGGLTSSARVRAGGSRRRYGTIAREVTISRAVGNATTPLGSATVTVTLPIMTKAAYNSLSVGADYTYAGSTWVVAAKRAESSR